MKTTVSQYFDSIASDYRRRYDERERPYHSYLHQQRLHLATRDVDFQGKRVLDIGAGTGSLYDEICRTTSNSDYFACDISSEMLEQSKIPSSKRAVGEITELNLPSAAYDLIFMLGVSTYIPPDAWRSIIVRVATLLAPGGNFIVSYTNPKSLDWHVRSLIRAIWRGRGVLGQSFRTYGYEPEVATPPLRAMHADWYNASLTPINTLLPNLSLRVAKWADQRLPQGLRTICCADIVAAYCKL